VDKKRAFVAAAFVINEVDNKVARWFVFKPKIPIWVNFGGPWNGKCWYILWPFGNVVVIWCIFPRFGIHIMSKNLATLDSTKKNEPIF
jgi:hypothetical protein